MSNKPVPVLCLDLDGTVRRSKSGKIFLDGADDVEIIPGMVEKILQYREVGWLVYGMTNQGGVAHGFRTIYDVHAELYTTIKLMQGCFHHIFYCPYDEKGSVEPYNRKSLSRKPQIGMLVAIEEKVFHDFHVYTDWNMSLIVGDRDEDMQCAKNAGISFMWAHDFLTSANSERV